MQALLDLGYRHRAARVAGILRRADPGHLLTERRESPCGAFLDGGADVFSAHVASRRAVFWALTNAGTLHAEHARAAAEGAPRIARAFAMTRDASAIFEALAGARRRGFPVEHVPRLLANRLGYVPGADVPLAWALLEIEAGIAPAGAPVRKRERERERERERADVWRKRLARALAVNEAHAIVKLAAARRQAAPVKAQAPESGAGLEVGEERRAA